MLYLISIHHYLIVDTLGKNMTKPTEPMEIPKLSKYRLRKYRELVTEMNRVSGNVAPDKFLVCDNCGKKVGGLINGRCEKCLKKTEPMEQEWRKELTEAYETAASFDDASDVECLIRRALNLIHKVRQEARGEGCIQAYKLFLEEIRNAKAKFPSRNEFELVVDVRDVEKSIKHLVDLQSLKK
jgi:hypothetical protein